MLQAAFGGYTLVEDSIEEFNDPLVYYEPGFNFMSPIEFSITKTDTIYILIRKRVDSSGEVFENLDYTSLSVTAKDVTNGETLAVRTSNNSTYTPWNLDPSANTPVLLQIENQLDLVTPLLRVRVIDCEVKDITDNSFINFRIIVDEDPEDLHFNYIPVHRTIYSDRNTFTASGRQAYVTLRSDSDSYILVSPYAWLKEETKDLSDFSYPPDTFYYQREKTYNLEDFTFSLQSWGHSWVEENVSIVNVPGYKKVAVILIDNAIYNNMKAAQGIANFVMAITGELSGIEDTFTVNLHT